MADKKDFERKGDYIAFSGDPTKRIFRASSVCDAIEEFVDGAFRGCAEVNVGRECDGMVLLSTDCLAIFLKSLFKTVFGRAFLTINLKILDDRLTFNVATDKSVTVSADDVNRLIRMARNAGITVDSTEDGFNAYLSFLPEREYSVYAITAADGKRFIISKLREVFEI